MTDITQPASEMSPAEAAPKRGLFRRIISFPATAMVLGFFWFMFCYGLSQFTAGKLLPVRGSPVQTLVAIGYAAFAVLCWKGYKRWIEAAPDTEMPFAPAPREFGQGLITGFLLFSLMTGIVALLGGFVVLGLRGVGQLWAILSMSILSGFYEEIIFRGVLFRHLETMFGSWAALAATSAFFGLAHILNPNATWFSSFAIAVEAGILLGAAYLLTRRLWFPIAIHAAWNFTQGWVFSVPVSGSEVPLGLLITRRVGPDWLTGGDFGLEASVVAMVVATLAGIVMLVRAIRRDGVRRPMWVKNQTKL